MHYLYERDEVVLKTNMPNVWMFGCGIVEIVYSFRGNLCVAREQLRLQFIALCVVVFTDMVSERTCLGLLSEESGKTIYTVKQK